MKMGVLIPSYQPDEKLTALIEKLNTSSLDIIVVNDGSTENTEIFDTLNCTVVHHNINKGKGAALKTGFKYMMDNGYTAAVTADSDGQHSPEDICNIINELQNKKKELIDSVIETGEESLTSLSKEDILSLIGD